MNQTAKWISIVIHFFLMFFTLFILFPLRFDNVFIAAVNLYYGLIVVALGMGIYMLWERK